MKLGPYEIDRIYNEDCIEGMKKLPDGCVDCVVTDPPYGVSYKTGHRKQKNHKFCNTIQSDDNLDWLHHALKQLYRIMANDSAIYMFCNHDVIDVFKPLFADIFTWKNTITWVKNNWTAGDLYGQFGKQTELILYGSKGRSLFRGYRYTDVWKEDRVSGDTQLHQNQKPVALISKAIQCSSDSCDIVFDGWMGSGTTAVACHKTDRHFIGFELDKTYYDIACQRIKDAQAQMDLFRDV